MLGCYELGWLGSIGSLDLGFASNFDSWFYPLRYDIMRLKGIMQVLILHKLLFLYFCNVAFNVYLSKNGGQLICVSFSLQLAEAAKAQFSRDYNDHLALVRAYEGWKEVERDVARYEYC